MQLISVNIGEERSISRAKSSGKTGIYKIPAEGPVRITALGIPGDSIVDTKHHGGYDQALYLYGADDYAWWSQELGVELAPGTFGENLTITGLESARRCVGDRLLIGNTALEVTAPRIPCVTLSARMGDPQFVKRFADAERPGCYCRVLQEGTIQAGDKVSIEPYQNKTVTILEMFRYYYEKNPPIEYLQRHQIAPTPEKGKRWVEKLLQEQAKP